MGKINKVKQELMNRAWAKQIQEYQESGLKMSEWCRSKNIKVNTFNSRMKLLGIFNNLYMVLILYLFLFANINSIFVPLSVPLALKYHFSLVIAYFLYGACLIHFLFL